MSTYRWKCKCGLAVSVIYVDSLQWLNTDCMGMNLLRRHTVHTFIRNWVIKTKPVLHTLLKLFVSGQKEWKNWNSNDLEQAQKPCGRPVFLYHSNTGLYQWKHIQNPIFQLVLDYFISSTFNWNSCTSIWQVQRLWWSEFVFRF